MLYCRGLQPAGYVPTLFDVTAVYFEIYDHAPVVVNQLKAGR